MWWITSALAMASGLSMDIELVQPTFSDGAVPGVDAPVVIERWATQVGVSMAYTRDPLVLYEYEEEAGAVVVHRAVAVVGASMDLSKKFSVRVSVPMGWQGGSDVSKWAADGAGLMDATIGGRAHVLDGRPLDVGVRLDVRLPTGRKLAWMGEAAPRVIFGPLVQLQGGPLRWLTDLSLQARANLDSDADFVLGTELALSSALALAVWPERVELYAAVISRLGSTNFLAGGGENAAEALLGVQLELGDAWRVDVGVGRGLTEGYGTSELRAFSGLTWRFRSPKQVEIRPEEPPVIMVQERPPELDIPELAPDPPRDWEEGQLARVEESRIVIREPIQFELATARILSESEPVLEAVSELLHTYWQIAHLVVEGHASIEGETDYNFELSNDRARSVFQALVSRGVHPSRLSYRGMGEVVPVVAGETEEALARNRRVEFKILIQLHPVDAQPVYPPSFRQPWDGAERETVQPGNTLLPTDQADADGPLEVIP